MWREGQTKQKKGTLKVKVCVCEREREGERERDRERERETKRQIKCKDHTLNPANYRCAGGCVGGDWRGVFVCVCGGN